VGKVMKDNLKKDLDKDKESIGMLMAKFYYKVDGKMTNS